MAPKFYAVVHGTEPGVVTTWEECKQRTNGVPGARFKSFSNVEDASAYLSSGGVDHVTGQFYAVWVGRTPGVYDSWSSAQAQIQGYRGAQFKGFSTRELANQQFEAGPPPKFKNTPPSESTPDSCADVYSQYGDDPPF